MPPAESTALRISVALVTYNGERFLREQLDSILDQSPRPDEIVIGDDGSQDSTLAIIQETSARIDLPVRVLTGEHLGLRTNVERTLAACHGDVIVLSDQDDVWMAGKLAAVRDAFTEPDVALWFSDAELVDENGARLAQRLWDFVTLSPSERVSLERGAGLRRLLYGQTITGATMALRASMREIALPLPPELDGDDHLYLHDGWIAVLASLVGRIVTDPHVFIHYRRHAAQVTTQDAVRQQSLPARGALTGRSALAIERDQVRLVLNRVHDKDVSARCRAADLKMLIELDEFLTVRALPPSRAKARSVWEQLRLGRYAAYSRGWRTAAADVFAIRRG